VIHTPARSLLVVGDRFADFADAVGATTITRLTRALDAGDFDPPAAPAAVTFGQGIGDYEVAYLQDTVKRRALAGQVELRYRPSRLVNRQDVHKARQDNVLIADLTRTAPDTYQAELRLHDHNELLLDAQDRVHIQGMVAAEASRQMFLAVTEQFYTSQWPRQRYYIVLNSMNTAFENFLFPVRATLRLRIDSADLHDPARLVMQVTIDVEQAGRRAASTTVDFAAFASGLLEDKELRRAKHALTTSTETIAT
jgi:A-factor biosynthesis hotdog domain